MKKIILLFGVLCFGLTAVNAQNAFVGGHRAWSFALEGGPLYSINENHFSYRDNAFGSKLFSWQGAASVGYEFTNALGGRLWVAYGKNRGAANTMDTAQHGFYPYDFKSVNGFFDITFDLNGNFEVRHDFRPILYLGVGAGHTFGFTKPSAYGTPKASDWQGPFHPWQDIETRNTVFGFRGGFIAEYDFRPEFGVFADFCGEAYNDQYNGLQPTKQDQSGLKGYAGFPFDMRFSVSLGIIYRIDY